MLRNFFFIVVLAALAWAAVWFADHRSLHVLGRRLTHYEAHHSPWMLAAVALAGARG